MSRRLLIVAALIAAASGCAAGHGGSSGAESTHELSGAIAPAFELESVTGGGAVGPAKSAGKVLIVDFWATWCAPCRDSFPAYQRLVDKFGGKLVVIGVSVDEDDKGIAAFRSETGVSFPLVWDRDQSVAAAYKPAKMPTSFIIDQKGLIRAVHEGYHSGDDAEIERTIAGLLK